MKLQPSQARSVETIELIVNTTGRLLEEIGFDRLSTNLVCQHASLTPPALYRYFPNKYALLRELGDRLMRLQDDAVLDWVDAGGLIAANVEDAIAKNFQVQSRVNEITRAFPGNIQILRALRAIPLLKEVRIVSRDMVSDRLADAMAPLYPTLPLETLRLATRMTTEMGYAATEMVLEEPDRDADQITWEVSRMVVQYYRTLAASGMTQPQPVTPKR
jgi:AcrR family transcriptional regulator